MTKDEAWENYRTALGRYAEAYVRAGEVVADEVAARLRGAGSLLDEAVALIAVAAAAEATATGPERDLRDLERLAQRYECVTVELGTLNLSVWRGKPAGYDEALWQCREHGHGLSSRSRAEDVAKIKIKCLLPEGSEGGKE